MTSTSLDHCYVGRGITVYRQLVINNRIKPISYIGDLIMKCTLSALALGTIITIATSTSTMAQGNPTAPLKQVPGQCPPGWIRATPPLNPQLGCIPNQIQTQSQPELKRQTVQIGSPNQTFAPPSNDCPPGFQQATHPVNGQLGCLPNTFKKP